ncbi:ATP-binding protein [Rubrolithibacter danxiaensis]|uniref:ATP-binding protein n=1 Tax=Rubrolithibacter danxiaensis TaxID=3390805 RepID=UPI003BF86110
MPDKFISFEAFFKTAPPTVILEPDIPDFTIITVNKAYLDATGAQLEELIGRGFLDAFPENPLDTTTKNVEALRESITQAVLTKEQHVLPSQKYDIPVWGTDKYEERYWKATNSPIVNEYGEVEFIVHVTLDITAGIKAAKKERLAFEIAEAQRKVTQQIEERLRIAVDSARLGTWHIDVETRDLIASDRLKEIFGFYPTDEITLEMVISRVKEDYRESVAKAIEESISLGKACDREYPIIGYHDNRFRWVRATGNVYEAQSGRTANFSGTIMDITDRKLDEIRKNDFIAMVSHELKTPLTSAKAYTQMLIGKANKAMDSFTAKALERIYVQIEKMNTLIKGFLDVSRIEAGKIPLDIQKFDLYELLKESVAEIKAFNESYPIILKDAESLIVNADRDKISQAINNLLTNAVKYSEQDKRIEVSCSKKDTVAIVSVKDEGVGIMPKDIEHIFDRFYRVESNQLHTIPGFGIGLYVCAEIIKRHNGNIWVKSEPGKGSEFYFSLPLTPQSY